jgi:hypothetical protein
VASLRWVAYFDGPLWHVADVVSVAGILYAAMKNLFEPATAAELKVRLDRLRSDSPRQWGKMTPAQAMAHCAMAFEPAVGESCPPRMALGYVLGPIVKRLVLRTDAPLGKNGPTAPNLIIRDDRDLEMERARLRGFINRFIAAGPASAAAHPHAFFGRLTPDQWAVLMYKHIDHHLRQFGV